MSVKKLGRLENIFYQGTMNAALSQPIQVVKTYVLRSKIGGVGRQFKPRKGLPISKSDEKGGAR
jgi:hypothetical protein